MPPKIIPRPDLAALRAIAFGETPDPPKRRPTPTRQEMEQRRFRLAKVQMDAVVAAFHMVQPATPDDPIPESLTGAISRGCAGLTKGRPCRRAVHVVASTIPLCLGHMESMVSVMTGALEQVELPPPPPPVIEATGVAVVYYMGDPPTQLIKIGTTTKIRARWNALRNQKPELVLLAIEPGTYDVEGRRHRQFRHLRVPDTREWFRKVPQLMDHINAVRAQHGIYLGGRDFIPPWGVAKLKPLVVPEQVSA